MAVVAVEYSISPNHCANTQKKQHKKLDNLKSTENIYNKTK